MEISIYEILHVFTLGMDFAITISIALYFLITDAGNRLYRKAFGITMLMCALQIMGYMYILLDDKMSPEFNNDLVTAMDMTIIPLFLVVILSLLLQVNKPRRLMVMTLLAVPPFITFLVTYLIDPSHKLIIALYVFAAIYIIIGVGSALVNISRNNKLLHNTYADTEDRDFSWITKVIVMHLLNICMYVVIIILDNNFNFLYPLFSLMIWVYMAHCIYRQREVDYFILEQSEVDMSDDMTRREVESGMRGLTGETLDDRLQEMVIDEQLYLRPDLTIRDVALAVGSNISYISAHINNVLGKNFTTYINELRLNEAKRILVENPNISVEHVSVSAGFNSVITMQRAFNTIVGLTPAAYRAKRLEELKDEEKDKEASIMHVVAKNEALNLSSLQQEYEERRFRNAFDAVFPEFMERLHSLLPTISRREELLCMLIVINKDNEEITTMLGVGHGSLNVARSRLRQKMKMERAESLEEKLKELL